MLNVPLCNLTNRDRIVTTVIAIGAAGALGSVLRYLLGRLVQGGVHAGFPIGTLTVNVLGCVIVGALSRHFLNYEFHPLLKSALIVGFCGGFTTFSAFSLETVGLLSGGAIGKALLYVTSSLLLCLAGTATGFFALPR
jgi:fluoride exporter